MDIEKLIEAVKLCGSTPKVDQCKQCTYWAGGDMSKCIPRMTLDAATALSTLQIENQALRNAANSFKAENEGLWAELEHWKNAHHQAALNFQQENRECNKVLAELEQVKAALRREQE